MDTELLIAHGNHHRNTLPPAPAQALSFYIQAMLQDPLNGSAWNNYGNVVREAGFPDIAIPYLKRAIALNPTNITAQFNLAVCYLLLGDYKNGWPAYESRWQYEHLAGLLPNWPNQWQGENLQGKTILVIGEQGLGDTIQFIRFVGNLAELGARVVVQAPHIMLPLINGGGAIAEAVGFGQPAPVHDYWIPIMSIPRILGITLDMLNSPTRYLAPHPKTVDKWEINLGNKTKPRIGFGWTGRRDTWINQHKAVPFGQIYNLINQNPQYEWVNLQVDCTAEEGLQLANIGVRTFPGQVTDMNESSALMMHMDVILGVDTAVSHLAAALGRPTWVMLSRYALDWRWLLDRADSPWYPTATLFRQAEYHLWDLPIANVEAKLTTFL